jgi:O-antigen/teichoic acid export membrane protein
MADTETVLSDTRPAATFEQNILLTAKGGSIVFVGKLFNFGSRLVITFLLTRLLGPEQYGLYNIALSAATIASGLALLGLDTALMRYVALYASRRDEGRVWGSLQIAIGISMVLSALMSAVLFGLAHVIAVEVFHNAALAPVLQLISFAVPFLGLSDVLAGATRGFKHMEHMVIAQNFAQPASRVILIIVFALTGLSLMEAVISFALADMVASLILFYFLHRQFSLKRPLGAAQRETREILAYSVPMWLSQMITTFRGSIQMIMLGSLNSVFSVGIFSVANQLNLFADLVQTSVTTAVRPIIVEVYDGKNREQLGRLYQTVSKWIFSFNFPVFLIIVLFPAPIMSIFGKGFVEGAAALVLLSWASLVDAVTGMCGAILDMTGYTRLKLMNAIIRIVLVILLSLLLIPSYGMTGAAVAVLVGVTVLNVLRVVEVYVLFRLLPYNLSSFKPILAGIAAWLVALTAGDWLSLMGENVQIILRIALLVSVYVGALLLLGLDPEDRAILSRVKKRANRRFSHV